MLTSPALHGRAKEEDVIVMMPNGNLKKLSPEDKAFLTGFCAATDRAVSLLYNVRFLDNHEDVRKTLEKKFD